VSGQLALKEFSAPTRVVAGLGASAQAGEYLSQLTDSPVVACVIDEALLSGRVLDKALSSLPSSHIICPVPGSDPSPGDVEALVEQVRGRGCNVVFMAGGGSAVGAGKAVALRLTNDGHVEDYLGRDKAGRHPAPSVALPTTAGSGSEVSSVIVLHDHARERIVVLRGARYEPDIAILDGALVAGLPDRPLLNAAFDALSHAMESLWAIKATAFTTALATFAAREIRASLPAVVSSRREGDLQRLLEASTMANLACGPAELALVHALATSSGAIHLPHGYQTGILLTHVADFNSPVLDVATRALVDEVSDLYSLVGFPTRFLPGEVTAAQVATVAEAAHGSGFYLNNIRESAASDLVSILQAAGAGVNEGDVHPAAGSGAGPQ